MRCEEERAETSVKKLVMHDKMQVSDEDLMERRLSASKMIERRCRGLAEVPKIRLTSLAGARQFVYIFKT